METILCAATWYKKFPLVQDDFPKGFCRPLNCDVGIVFSGHRHHNCLYQMCAITGKTDATIGEHVQGFLTSKNRFVDRSEAAEIFRACGGTTANEHHLFSEDLY